MRLYEKGGLCLFGSSDKQIISLQTVHGDDVQVGWERAYPPNAPREHQDTAERDRLPWRVTYHYRGTCFATEWHDAILSPGGVDAWLLMHATIERYEPPVPPPPPRRGLLYHLFDGLQRWYGHGT